MCYNDNQERDRAREENMFAVRKAAQGIAFCILAIASASNTMAQEVKHYRFAYDQPKTTGYGIAGDLFADKVKELSNGTMLIDQYPGAQLGQEPQVLHLVKAIADPQVTQAVRDMIEDTVQGAHVLAVMTLGLRSMYSKTPISKVEDVKGLKVRVQATATEDLMFPVYGAQTVHMPFGSVYTSLQTGVVDVAENSVNIYLANKHYEVAPILSMTEHEANNNLIWISDKLWRNLTAEQKQWVQTAADEVGKNEPAKALGLEHQSAEKLKTIGVRIVDKVDKSGFQKLAEPYLDKLAGELGPHAVKIKDLIVAVK